MHDMGILTGGSIVDEEMGSTLDNSGVDILGTAKKVVITKDDTIIIDGAGKKEDIAHRVS